MRAVVPGHHWEPNLATFHMFEDPSWMQLVEVQR